MRSIKTAMETGAAGMCRLRANGVQAYATELARGVAETTGGHDAHGINARVAREAIVDRVRYPGRVTTEVAAAP